MFENDWYHFKIKSMTFFQIFVTHGFFQIFIQICMFSLLTYQNFRLSMSVENHSYIHFLASDKSKLTNCHSRKLSWTHNWSKNSFWTQFCHISHYFYRSYFLQNAKNMPFDFVEYSTSPVEISDLPTKIFEFFKLRR